MPSLRIAKENENTVHFLTITTIAWLDVFTSEKYFDILISSLKFCQRNKGLLLYEFVFMTNHIHLICATREGFLLSQVISDFKKHTTHEILKLVKEDNRKYLLWILKNSFMKKESAKLQLWQSNNHPKVMEGDVVFQKANYIHENPVRKGYVEKPENWKYASARNRFLEDHSLIKVEEW